MVRKHADPSSATVMILVIDNYDSFTYNLVHLLARNDVRVEVVRNDAHSVEELRRMDPHGIVISPGPGRPADAGVTNELIRTVAGSIPVLGVCLGHQAIAEVFGGKIDYAPDLMHGKTSPINHDGRSIFAGVAQSFEATRYHSLVVDGTTLPECLEISATSDDGVVMGVRHKNLAIKNIQFHPESVLTTEGPRIIENWIRSVLQSVVVVGRS